MGIEQEVNTSDPKHQEFAKLLDQDLKDRKLIENQVIKAKVVEILKSYIVCDAKAKSEATTRARTALENDFISQGVANAVSRKCSEMHEEYSSQVRKILNMAKR